MPTNWSSRPGSFEEVFKHRLFDAAGKLRFLKSTDESWEGFVGRQASVLRSAIEMRNSEEVQQLFTLGSVHIDMSDNSIDNSTVPLHLAAFTGNVTITRILTDEISDAWPDKVKSKFLDRETALLNYTPFMLACKCGHTEVARLLKQKGCNTMLCNSSGKTGGKLLEDFQREVLLSVVHPWNRGDQLHLAATSPEAFLAMAKAELNTHLFAGMKIWSSKQMVWHFDKEQMRALQTQTSQHVLMHVRARKHAHTLAEAHRHAHRLMHTQIHPHIQHTHAHTHTHTHTGPAQMRMNAGGARPGDGGALH